MNSGPQENRVHGFTMLEILVAMAILAVLVVLLAAMMSGGTSMLRQSRDSLDAYSQMRFVFDKIQNDFQKAIWRDDTSPAFRSAEHFVNVDGNDPFVFLSSVNGYEGDRSLSVTGYRVDGPSQSGNKVKVSLQRGVDGSHWMEPGLALSFGHAPDAGNPGIAVTETSFEDMAALVFRMELSFVARGSGAITRQPPPLEDLHSVIITLAALEPGALKRTGQTATIDELISRFDDTSTTSPAIAWQETIDAATGGDEVSALLRQTKILQRQFYVRP